ncbi:CRISPR-associated protein Cas2 [Bergeyella sp. RCAD1439]|uniref:CRISPR-associated protein Cas2 n=1 Tax=Bergeyella anatis TaxID=3113737 RepID=UPI002E19174C|nr:CRISPR-associated protein Cas2 [Bergeyella sp. RCAD1439]
MKSILIGYDLNSTGQNYESLIEAIKEFGIWWHCLDSTWIIKTSLTPEQIRDKLLLKIDANDELLVVELVRNAAWYGFNKECSDWLQNNL